MFFIFKLLLFRLRNQMNHPVPAQRLSWNDRYLELMLSEHYSETICRRHAHETVSSCINSISCVSGLREPSVWPSEMMFSNIFITCTIRLSFHFCLRWIQRHCSWMASWQPHVHLLRIIWILEWIAGSIITCQKPYTPKAPLHLRISCGWRKLPSLLNRPKKYCGFP